MKNKLVIIFLILGSQVAVAALTPMDLTKELKGLKTLNAFDVPSKKSVDGFSTLAQVKVYEVRKNYNLCREAGLKVLNKSEVKEWLALTVLQCGLADSSKKTNLSQLVKTLKAIKIEDGPWRSSWGEAWGQAHLRLTETAATDKERQNILNSWLHFWDFLSKENQGRWFEAKGMLNLRAKKSEEAAFFFKQAQDLYPQRHVQEHLDSILKKNTNEGPIVVATPASLQREQEQDDRIQKLLSEGQPLAAQQQMVLYLREFPQGKNAKRYKDRAFEIYLSQPVGASSQDEALKNLLEGDGLRIHEWALVLHRRLDYRGTLALCEAALPKLRETSFATSLLWMAGRSAHFLGKYQQASQYFDELIQKHSGTEESLEAQFRLGLIQYRLEGYPVAAALMERLRAFGKDKYELNAWYWQIRSLEKNGDLAKAQEERERLIERFPFSYYGLRLRAEKNNGLIQFSDKPAEVPTTAGLIYLLPHQSAAWKRFKVLIQNGWIIEAQQELSLLPQPVTAGGQWKWVQILSKSAQHQAAIMMLNRLTESEQSVRHPVYMNFVFPKDYSQWIEAEAKKYNLDPDLIRSLIRQESAFTLRAVSTSNALGLMQMIPPTAEEVSRKLKLRIQIPQDMYRPEVNIPMGTFYISDMLDQFSKNVPMALAAYNAGPHRLKQWMELRQNVTALRDNHSSSPLDEIWFDELPWTETSFYIKAILRNIIMYRLVDKGPVPFKPVFWSDLVLKKADAAASPIVK